MAMRILIAEEDDDLRDVLASRLRQPGDDVRVASDAESAVDILSDNEIDVAVIGLEGFEGQGLDLLKMCRSARYPAEVILLVGKHQGSLAIRGMKLGAFRDAQLPIHIESLREIVHEAYEARVQRMHRKKRRLRRRWSDVFAAVTFAEAGEFEVAKQFRDGDPGKKTGK